MDSSPIGKRTKDLSDVIARVEFEPFRENIDEMKAVGIPDYHQHHFSGLRHKAGCRSEASGIGRKT
jgi:hypothetical protein